MRTTEDVLNYIETLIGYSLERPEMYAPNPIALENALMVLDDLAAFILSQDGNPSVVYRSAYSGFLMERGFGASRFTSRLPDDADQFSTRDKFKPLCDFWLEYLNFRRERGQ